MGLDFHYVSSSKQIDLISMFCHCAAVYSFGTVTYTLACLLLARRGTWISIDDVLCDKPVARYVKCPRYSKIFRSSFILLAAAFLCVDLILSQCQETLDTCKSSMAFFHP